MRTAWEPAMAALERRVKDAEETPLLAEPITARDGRLLFRAIDQLRGQLSLARHYNSLMEQRMAEIQGRVHELEADQVRRATQPGKGEVMGSDGQCPQCGGPATPSGVIYEGFGHRTRYTAAVTPEMVAGLVHEVARLDGEYEEERLRFLAEETRRIELEDEVARLRALLTEALDEWTSAYQCETMSEGDRLAEFEQRAHVALAGKGQ